MKADTELTRDK